MQTYHEWHANGKHYRAVIDEHYRSEGSYAYDTEEETQKAVKHEEDMLERGEWVALGIIVTQPCSNSNHCESCTGHEELDSLWGCVVENSPEAIMAFAAYQGM